MTPNSKNGRKQKWIKYNSEHSMGRDGLVFVNVRKDIVKLKKEKNLAEAPFKEHGAGTSIRWSHW